MAPDVRRDGLVKEVRLRPVGLPSQVRDLLMEFVRKLDRLGNHGRMIALIWPDSCRITLTVRTARSLARMRYDASPEDKMEQATDQEIRVDFPDATDRQLRITVGPGGLKIAPGTAGEWVTGTYRDPTGSIPARVAQEGGTVRISQSYNRSLPRLSGMPIFDLRLGTQQPYALTLEGGANDNYICDLGGLPLTRLDVRHGAAQIRLDFSAPNPQPMERLRLQIGAAEVEVTNLANANAAEIAVDGGAAAFKLDFGGTLARDASVRITAGAASVELALPSTTAAKVVPHAVLGGVEAGDGFETRNGGYWTKAAVAGATPLISVDANVTLGSLKLRTT